MDDVEVLEEEDDSDDNGDDDDDEDEVENDGEAEELLKEDPVQADASQKSFTEAMRGRG